MRRQRALCVLTALLAGGAWMGCKGGSGDGGSGGNGTGGAGGDEIVFAGAIGNLDQALNDADFVFEGEITAIEYRNASNNGTGGPDPDDADDAGVVPHAFVTYQIMEDFSGNAAGDTVTMRFIGGVDDTTGPDYDIVHLAQGPRFDIGDRDIVLMRGNTEIGCPIVGCADGRFRVLQSPDDDQPYVFSEFGQEVRVVEDNSDEGHLFMVGEHRIPDILEHQVAMPDGETALFILEFEDEPGEVDPVPRSRAQKHSFEPLGDLSPLDEPSEAFGAPVAGVRVTPAQFRALIRKAIADHPDFAWLPYANADPAEPFTMPTFVDVPGPANDDDPRVTPPEQTAYEEAEAAAAEAADFENDGSIDPALIFDIQSRRETETGIVELPNEEDEDSAAEDMWTEQRQ